MDYKGYTIELESVYNKDYQCDCYRAVIIGQDSNVIRKGTNLFSLEDEVYNEGKELIDSIVVANKYKEYGINYDSKVWSRKSDKLGYFGRVFLFSVIYVLVVVLFIMICSVCFGYESVQAVLMLIFLLSSPIVVLLFYKKCLSPYFTNFIFDKGILYIVKFYNNDASLGYSLSALGYSAVGAAVAINEVDKNIQYQNNMSGIDDIYKLSDQKSVRVWTIDKVIEVKKIDKDNYKVTFYYYKGDSNKKKRKTIHLKNVYNDFYMLINCFEAINSLN